MIPNHVLFYSFGKCIFSLCDVLCGILIFQIFKNKGIETRNNLRLTSLWVFNPYVIYLSTRGSADSLECLFVFLTLLLLLRGKIAISAIVFGISVHFKLYPIVYSLALFCFCFSKSWRKALRFALISASVFLSDTIRARLPQKSPQTDRPNGKEKDFLRRIAFRDFSRLSRR